MTPSGASDPIRVADTRAWLTKVLRDIAREVIDALLGRFPADVRSCRNS